MTNCKTCGSEKARVTFKKDKWEVIECLECEHGTTSPVPTQSELEKIYNGEYYSYRYTEKRSLTGPIRHERHRIKLIRRHHKQGDILDVGIRGWQFHDCTIGKRLPPNWYRHFIYPQFNIKKQS